ncbi:MAG: RiPP maturation radical SAM C-methyltransferase [Gimesia sp.]
MQEFYQSTLLIVPPFVRLNMASLGVHVLQGCAKQHGHGVDILYASLLFAEKIGEPLYQAITFSRDHGMIGDRIFTESAFGQPPLGKDAAEEMLDYQEIVPLEDGSCFTLDYPTLLQAAKSAVIFIEELTESLSTMKHQVVGCSSMFQQTCATMAILAGLKKKKPEVITILGGADCNGEMATGIASLSDQVDFIFSGECEQAFVTFLDAVRDQTALPERIIQGHLCKDLNQIPSPDFQDYYHQLAQSTLNIPVKVASVPYESSRGCWWGQYRPCTFCSLFDMNYRMKAPERVLQELRVLQKKYPGTIISFTDNILPNPYFKNLLPILKKELPGLQFFVEVKANLSLNKVRMLKEAGAYHLQPGIEALSTPLLDKMDKGIDTRRIIQLMRYARSCLIYLSWFLLYGFPGDHKKDYEYYPELLPMLSHLSPPRYEYKIQIQRYGAYATYPDRHGLSNLRPWKGYHDIYPEESNFATAAFFFDADYTSIVQEAPELVDEICELVQNWRDQWTQGELPSLTVDQLGPDMYRLSDTRGLEGTQSMIIIDEQQAAAVLVGQPLHQLDENWEREWAIKVKAGIELDGWLIPLATATPDLLDIFERKYRT